MKYQRPRNLFETKKQEMPEIKKQEMPETKKLIRDQESHSTLKKQKIHRRPRNETYRRVKNLIREQDTILEVGSLWR